MGDEGKPLDLGKLRTVGHLRGGRSRQQTREWRDEGDGHRIKAVKDDAGNIVTEHNTKDDRVDVEIRPEAIKVDLKVT